MQSRGTYEGASRPTLERSKRYTLHVSIILAAVTTPLLLSCK
jgi:hypothetical protein